MIVSDAAVANIVATIVTGGVTVTTLVVGFLTLWVKLRYGAQQVEKAAIKADVVEKKIDSNTAITKAGTEAAATNAKAAEVNAKAAEVTAKEAKNATTALAKTLETKLNGGVDAAIESAVKPLRDAMLEHAIQDDANMKEIRIALDDLKRRIR